VSTIDSILLLDKTRTQRIFMQITQTLMRQAVHVNNKLLNAISNYNTHT